MRPVNREKRIYIASSWKNENWLKKFRDILVKSGHLVDLFCDDTGRTVFNWGALCRTLNGKNPSETSILEIIDHSIVIRAFNEDKKWIDWADIVVLALPCGKSAHMEAGYAKGAGKKLYVIGDFQPGEFDLMYKFADGLFTWEQLDKLKDILQEGTCTP